MQKGNLDNFFFKSFIFFKFFKIFQKSTKSYFLTLRYSKKKKKF